MSNLGFYTDIAGIKDYLKTDNGTTKVMGLIYALGNDLYKIGEYSSSNTIARLFAYQMGDGFMVHFDNTKYNDKNCCGTAIDMVNLTIVLAQRFLVEHGGILRIGLACGEIFGLSESGFTFANQANNNNGNGYHCGQGLFFLLPIMGTLLAETYPLTTKQAYPKPERHEPRIWIHSILYSVLGDMQYDFQKVPFKEKCKDTSEVWQYGKIIEPSEKIIDLYRKIWSQEITAEKLSDALNRYNKQ
jgi:hypothetical protein